MLEVIEALKWPLVVVITVVLLRQPITVAIHSIANRLSTIKIKPKAIEFVFETIDSKIKHLDGNAERESKENQARFAEVILEGGRLMKAGKEEIPSKGPEWEAYYMDFVLKSTFEHFTAPPPSGKAASILRDIRIELADEFPGWRDAVRLDNAALKDKR